MTNFKSADIFKGILETQKSTQNGERFAKSGAKKTSGASVYHARIKHDGVLHGANCLLSRPSDAAIPAAILEVCEAHDPGSRQAPAFVTIPGDASSIPDDAAGEP